MKPSVLLLFLALVAFAPVSEFAQHTPRVLSNADLVRMIREGTPESEIICAIGESEAGYDVSAKSLIELKQAGASELVLNAMLRRKGAFESSETPLNVPVSPGDTKLIAGGLPLGLTRAEYSVELQKWLNRALGAFYYVSGAASDVRISTDSLEFELSLPLDVDPSTRLILLKLEQIGNRRRVETGRRKNSVSAARFPKESVIPLKINKKGSYIAADGAKYVLYSIQPVNPLGPGEYSLTRFQSPIQFYDFAVD